MTMPVEEALEPLTSLRASSGRGEEAGGGLLSSLTLRGRGERGRRRAVEAWLTGGSLDALPGPITSLPRSELESSTKENLADGADRSTGEARPCVEGEEEKNIR